MITHTETLLRASIDMAKMRKTIELQKKVIAEQSKEIQLLNQRLNVLELKLMREAELNGNIPALLKRQAG